MGAGSNNKVFACFVCVKSGCSISQVFSSPLTDEQIDAIMDALDTDGDGTLSYAEFLEGFAVVDTSKATPSSSVQSSPQPTPPATP